MPVVETQKMWTYLPISVSSYFENEKEHRKSMHSLRT